MPAPLDAVIPIHNALRRDMTEIDGAAYKIAKHGGDLSPMLDRLQFHRQILMYHAEGETDGVFPALASCFLLTALRDGWRQRRRPEVLPSIPRAGRGKGYTVVPRR